MNKLLRLLLPLLLTVPLLAPQLLAEDIPGDGAGSAEPEDFFADVVDVTVVNVDVYVTDRKGNPITGLTQDDFEILDGGKPVDITNFYAIENQRVVAQSGVEPLAAPTVSQDPRLLPKLPEEQRLHLVLYVDNVNIHPLNRQKVMTRVRSFLRRFVGPQDRTMVVSYDRSLNVRQPFTEDKEEVIAALLETDELTGHRTAYNGYRDEVLRAIFDADELFDVSGIVRKYAESVYHDIEQSQNALKRTIDSLAGLPGRKAVLYISDGLEMKAGEDLFAALESNFQDQLSLLQVQQFDASRRFKAITTEATANRIVIYSLDAAGLRTNANADVTNYHPERASIIESTHQANLQEPLHFMANETGGQAIVNTNNFGPMLERVGSDFTTFYSLGFHARESRSGRYRDIDVRVKDRKKIIVRHRKGYRDQPVSRIMSDGTLAALHFGYTKNDLGIRLEFGPPTRRGGKSFVVPLVIKIPMGRLTFIPREALHSARLRLFITAKDDEDNIAPMQEVPVPIEIKPVDIERAQEADYQLQHTLVMSTGKQLVAVGVRDELGSTTSFVLGGLRLGGT